MSFRSDIQDVSFLEVPTQSFVRRRNLRIKRKVLPFDFFDEPLTPQPISRYLEQEGTKRDIKTPSFRCKSRCSSSMQETIDQERKIQTARTSLQKSFEVQGDNLTLQFVSQALQPVREKRRSFFDEKRSLSVETKSVRLPKILKRALLNKG